MDGTVIVALVHKCIFMSGMISIGKRFGQLKLTGFQEDTCLHRNSEFDSVPTQIQFRFDSNSIIILLV